MGFLAPWFLAGAAAVSLPVWIHLLRKYRSTPLPFSSLMFFERRTQSSIKHKRLRYLTLLALRIALLTLMALAFANPYVNRTAAASGGRHNTILAVDNSFSMRYGNHLDRAKQEALDTLAKLHAGDKAQVLEIDSQVHFLTQLTDDPAQLRAAVASIQPGDQRSSYGELARTLRTLSQSMKTPLQVHLFSDMQRSSMPPAFADLRLAPSTDLVLHSVAESHEPNWMVESVTAPGRVYDPKKVRVQAVVASSGAEAATRQVALVLDGKVLETKSVDVPANGRASVEFLSLETPYGFHRGEVRIEPHDNLSADDRFPFAVERTDPRRVLFLHRDGESRGELYYRSALEAASNSGFIVEPAPAEQAGSLGLSKYAFIILSDVGSLPSGLEANLKSYVAGGGSLLVALGPSSVALRHVPVLNLNIQESRYSGREGDRYQSVASVDPAHPALAKTNKLEGVEFFQTIKVDPGKARVIARLTDQTPLLLEQPVGEGRVLVFASTLDNISNDFPLHPSFLPFVEETARYLGGQQDRLTNTAVDSFIDLRTAKEQGATVDVIDPDGKRPMSLKEAATAQSFQVTREGFYEIHRANGRQELVAVHTDRRESDLTPIAPETLQLWKSTGRPDEAPANVVGETEQNRPWSLWRYALLLVLLLAIVESLFASRYLTVDKDTA
jgi:hypothetical protein